MAEVETYPSVWGAAAAGTDPTSLRALVYAYYKAVNDSKWDEVVSFFHSDATLLIPSQLPKIGHEAIRRFYEYHGGYNKLHHDDVPLLMLDGNRAVTLVEHHGVDKHDREIYLMTAGYFVFDGPKIRQYRVIFDTAQLHGAIPGVL